MAKLRKKIIDEQRTSELEIDELIVLETDNFKEDVFYVMQAIQGLPPCIKCKGMTKNHDKFERVIYDVIEDEVSIRFVTLIYCFYKYRCLSPNCKKMFHRETHFVRDDSKISNRLENFILRRAMYMPYRHIANLFPNLITAQAIGQNIHKYVAERDKIRGKMNTPSAMVLMSFSTGERTFLVVADASNAQKNCDVKLLEVIPEVATDSLYKFFSTLDSRKVKYVITDLNPTITVFVREGMPQIKNIIDIETFLDVALEDFGNLIDGIDPYMFGSDREKLLREPNELTEKERREVESLTRRHDNIATAYARILELRNTIKSEWEVDDIRRWGTKVAEQFAEEFAATASSIEEYWSSLSNFYARRNEIIDNAYRHLKSLDDLISKYKIYSEDVLRARILYPDFDFDKKEPSDTWTGAPLKETLKRNREIPKEKRRNKR